MSVTLVAPQYYSDLASTTLSSGYTAGAGSMVVTTPANLHATRYFFFYVADQTTKLVKAVGKATTYDSGTSTYGVTMTIDANCNSGDVITIALTAVGLDDIRGEMRSFGAFSSRPTSGKAGDSYKSSDAPYESIYQGSGWQDFAYGMPVTPPPSSGWTSENMSTGTVNYTNGYGYMVGGTSGLLEAQYVAAPGSTPYSFTAKFRVEESGVLSRLFGGNTPALASFAGWFIGWRDGSGKYSVLAGAGSSGNNYGFLGVGHFSSYSTNVSYPTFISGTDLTVNLFGHPQGFWIRIRNDGTNLLFQVSLDRNNWYTFRSETITSYLAAAVSVSWGSFTNGNGAVVCLDDWTQGV
jgi:hypothetical protein